MIFCSAVPSACTGKPTGKPLKTCIPVPMKPFIFQKIHTKAPSTGTIASTDSEPLCAWRFFCNIPERPGPIRIRPIKSLCNGPAATAFSHGLRSECTGLSELLSFLFRFYIKTGKDYISGRICGNIDSYVYQEVATNLQEFTEVL